MKKWIVGLILALCMAAVLLPTGAVAETTVSNVSYLDANGNTKNCDRATLITNDSTAWNAGWYVVQRTPWISRNASVSGDVYLILADKCALFLGGIHVPEGSSLTIYGQSTGSNMGKLTADNAFYAGGAGIGIAFDSSTDKCGQITINGGNVTATGGIGSAGIGGNYKTSGCNVLINGGIVNATGGSYASGIGGGGSDLNDNVNVTIRGGVVTARGSNSAAGIGSGNGYNDDKKINIEISNGVVTAIGAGGACGIGDSSSATHFSTGTDGTPTIYAISASETAISDSTYKTADTTSGIIFENSNGTVYGAASNNERYMLEQSFTIEEGQTLTVPAGTTLQIPMSRTLNNYGTLIQDGFITGAGKILVPAVVETFPTPISGLVYNGTPQELVTPGTASTGTMEYRLEEETDWSANIPTATYAKPDYKVYYRAAADDMHLASMPQYVTVTIVGMSQTATPPEPIAGLKCTGNRRGLYSQELVTAGKPMGGTMQYSLSEDSGYSTSIPRGTSVGEYTVWYKVVGNNVYTDVPPASVTAKIEKGTPVYVPPELKTGLVYTGDDLHCFSGLTFDVTYTTHIQYSESENGYYYNYDISLVNAGNYDIWYRINGGQNFVDIGPTFLVTVTVAKADSLISSNLKVMNGTTETNSFTYGDTITMTFTAAPYTTKGTPDDGQAALFMGETQLTDPVSPDADGKYTLTYDTLGKGIPTGTSTLTVKYSGYANVNADTVPVTIALNPKQLSVSGVTAVSRVYVPNDTTVELDFTNASITGRIGDDAVTFEGGTGSIPSADVSFDTNYAVTVSGIKLAGDAKEFYTLSGQPDAGTVRIASKPVENPTIIITPNSYGYTGGQINPISVVVQDGNDIIPASEYTLSYDNNVNASNEAKVIVTDNANGNYTVSGSAFFSIITADSLLGGLTVKNGTTETTTFTYGDTITVEFIPVVATPDVRERALSLNQAALFVGEMQLTAPVAPDASGKFTLTYDTTNKGIHANTTSTLTVKYGGSGNLNESSDTVDVMLNPQSVSISGVTAVGRYYVPNDTTVELDLTSASLNGRIGSDDVTFTGGMGIIPSADVNFDANHVIADYEVTVQGMTLAGEAKEFYALSGQPDAGTVRIASKPVENPTIIITPNSYDYTGGKITPTSVVVKDGEDVIPSSEYTLFYDNNIDAGEEAKVTVVSKFWQNYVVNGTAYFTITKADSQLSGLTVKNGTTETTSFTYGDTITVEFTSEVKSVLFGLFRSPTSNEAALFLGETQLTAPVAPDANGKFTLTYATTGKGLPAGTSTLTVKYGGNNNLNESVGMVSVTLNAKGVTLSGVTAISRTYAVNDTAVALDLTGAVVNGRVDSDDVTPTGGTGVMADANVGNGKAVTVKNITLMGAASSYYMLTAQPTGLIVDITPKEVANPTILLKPNLYYFTGNPIVPRSVVVKDGNNVIPQSEYTLSYANNIDVGESAQVIVTDNPGGNYIVSGDAFFTIAIAPPPKTGDSATPLLWLGLCLLGGAGVLTLTLGRRRSA